MIQFTRKPKNWLEKFLWNNSFFWKVYQLFKGEAKQILFNPYRMSCGHVIIHFQQIKENEAHIPIIDEEKFILWAVQRPASFAVILSHAISNDNQKEVLAWLEENCNPVELADGYLIYRRIMLELGDRMIGLADQFENPKNQ